MSLKEIIGRFSDSKITVIGDVMLDCYIYGSADRLSPEAPVPIIKSQREVYGIGGAANVAANIASLGGKVRLLGYVGRDSFGKLLDEKITENGIDAKLFPLLSETTRKTRIIGNNQQQIVRVDNEGYSNASSREEEYLAYSIFDDSPDVIIVSDYAKGVINRNVFSKIKQFNNGAKIIVDPKPKNKVDYSGVYLVKPNIKEAIEMSGEEDIDTIGKRLQEKLNSNILITSGKDGMSLFYDGDKTYNVPSMAREVYDITGAGDTVIGVVGLCLACGLSLEESVLHANQAAGIVVGKSGAATVSIGELERAINKESYKIKSLDELKCIRQNYKQNGNKVVWTNGCFDVLHRGHVDYLNKARELGNCLIVGVNSDSSVKRIKGDTRPVNNERDRAAVLSSLEFVDYVTIFDEISPVKQISELMPDIYAKGGDRNMDTINQEERNIVDGYGGRIEIIPLVHRISTTQIIDKIKGDSG
jgi:D-beta-D-heptose 7-phosphate kinase / D-beta-D-heptose 1-phosphate adenosyltransferase